MIYPLKYITGPPDAGICRFFFFLKMVVERRSGMLKSHFYKQKKIFYTGNRINIVQLRYYRVRIVSLSRV